MKTTDISSSVFTLRSDLRPGDLGQIIYLHGILFAREFGLDSTFEADIASQLAEFARSRGDGDRLWIIEHGSTFVGFAGVASLSPRDAQLAWLLIDPSFRGLSLQEWLLRLAITFCEHLRFECLFYWTLNTGKDEEKLYQTFGFAKVREFSRLRWGVVANESLYLLRPELHGACRPCDSCSVREPHS